MGLRGVGASTRCSFKVSCQREGTDNANVAEHYCGYAIATLLGSVILVVFGAVLLSTYDDSREKSHSHSVSVMSKCQLGLGIGSIVLGIIAFLGGANCACKSMSATADESSRSRDGYDVIP